MPSFVKIGRHDGNLSGNTSKGYFISRSRKMLTVKYGAIHSVNRKYYWAGPNLPNIVTPKFLSIEAAKNMYKAKIRDRDNEGYSKLRSDVRIYSFHRMP